MALGALGMLGGAAITATQPFQKTGSYQVTAFAGDPLEDCRASWPQFTHGKPAPKLMTLSMGRGLSRSVVTSVSDTDPYGGPNVRWTPLPKDWQANLKLTILNDQLNNITLALHNASSVPATNACSYERTDINARAGHGHPGCRHRQRVRSAHHTVRVGVSPDTPAATSAVVNPGQFGFSADGSGYAHVSKWTGWGNPATTAPATMELNACNPNCAQGSYTSYPGTTVLTDPRPCPEGTLTEYMLVTFIPNEGESYPATAPGSEKLSCAKPK